MEKFTYVIAPEGCESYFTPSKKYDIMEISYVSNTFLLKDNNGENKHCRIAKCAHLNGKDWIIPEIDQWPKGWTKKQKKECLVKACVIENVNARYVSCSDESNELGGQCGKWEIKSFSTNDNQGRSSEQLEGSYKIMNTCFIALFILIVLAAILI